jgi:putative endonuclease
MYFVYLLKSIKYPEQTYIGYTHDVNTRLAEHNADNSFHTSKFKPWKLITYIGFGDQVKALEFEKYLKSGSGHAFALKKLW